jgi:hypothetical protein
VDVDPLFGDIKDPYQRPVRIAMLETDSPTLGIEGDTLSVELFEHHPNQAASRAGITDDHLDVHPNTSSIDLAHLTEVRSEPPRTQIASRGLPGGVAATSGAPTPGCGEF